MSERDEELELQALQRELDDAFATTRPRPGFDDELWLRMQARRPATTRLRDALSGLWQGVREVPSVPMAAVATVVVVALGVGIFALSGLGRGGAGSSTGAGAQFAPAIPALAPEAGFGRVPSPVLSQSGKSTAVPNASGAPNDQGYAGPVKLVWAGTLDVAIASAPVYRYREPTTNTADAFAASLGAALRSRPGGTFGSYAATDYTLQVRGTIQSPPQSPAYFIVAGANMPPVEAAGAAPADLATFFLAEHSLVPTWPYSAVTDISGGTARVRLVRQFSTPGYGHASLVDANGGGYGVSVELKGNQPLDVTGLLPLELDTADYRLITSDRAVQMALVASPAPQAAAPIVVQLTQADLVYMLVPAGDHSFYEPAFMFSGSFQVNGATYVKRVLVPAVDPSLRS